MVLERISARELRHAVANHVGPGAPVNTDEFGYLLRPKYRFKDMTAALRADRVPFAKRDSN